MAIIKKSANTQLAGFSGTEQYYTHPILNDIVYTDGVRELFQSWECYWLLDAIVSHQPSMRGVEFQTWELERVFKKVGDDNYKPTNKFTLKGTDGNKKVIVQQDIDFSDFKDDEVRLFLVDNVLLLPSEY